MSRPSSFQTSRPSRAVVVDPGEMPEAIERGELEVWYQPQLDLVTGGLARFEALVRWRHPRLGVLLPAEFLPAAEEASEMARLGELVLGEAVAQVASWRELAPAAPGVSVNLSYSQAVDPRVPELVRAALDRWSVPAELLCVELAEASLMSAAVEDVVAALRQQGVRIAVDNFGTSSSSLSRIRRLGIHYLKIARQLVGGLGRNPDDTVVVEAVVQMAHTLGLLAVAEGVETLDQLGRLSDLGCDFAQGFYWSKAMLAADARRMVAHALVPQT